MNPRAAAIAFVRNKLGLNNQPSSWTYLERTNYNKELAGYIAAHPAEFPPAEVGVAGNVLAQANDSLADESFLADLNTFGSAFTDEVLNAGGKVAEIGTGVLNSAKFVGMLLPVAAIVLFGFLVFKGTEKIKAL